jgi:hypothetical protein
MASSKTHLNYPMEGALQNLQENSPSKASRSAQAQSQLEPIMFEASISNCNFTEELTGPNWYSDGIGTSSMSGSELMRNSTVVVSGDVQKQPEWWTEFIDDDWNEILDNTSTDTEARPVVLSFT